MIGMEGKYDFATRQITARMLSDQCDAVEFAAPGKSLPPLPSQTNPATAELDRRRPEMRVTASNVTNDLLPNPPRPLFEYLSTRSYDPAATMPTVNASVTHFGLSKPLPTMQIKAVLLGGATVHWMFARTGQAQPPEIYIHHWIPLTGRGPFDPLPEELERRKAAAPPCKTPRK
jgi:hypothetical protein